MNGEVGWAVIAQIVKVAHQPLHSSIRLNWEFSSNCASGREKWRSNVQLSKNFKRDKYGRFILDFFGLDEWCKRILNTNSGIGGVKIPFVTNYLFRPVGRFENQGASRNFGGSILVMILSKKLTLMEYDFW